MKTILTLISITVIMSNCNAQKNAINVELFGNGIFGSINYERQLTNAPKLFARIGIGFWSNLGVLGSSNGGYTIPISLNYFVNLNNNNFLDFGIGPTLVQYNFMSNKAPKHITYLFTNIGFRRNFGNHLFFGFQMSPFVMNLTPDTFKSEGNTIYITQEFDFNTKQWFGIQFGKRF